MPVARKRTRARRAPVGLTHEKIVTAALRVIDREGLDGFSTRKVGRALRCEAMAIYYYYPSKDALLDAVVDRLVAPLALAPEPTGDWVDAMRTVARAYRSIAQIHPRAFPLLATRRFASEGTYGFLEQLFALGRRHGISERTAARYYRTVSSYCNGFGLSELAAARELTDKSIAATRAKFPNVDGVFAWLGPDHVDDTFEFGLDLILRELARETERR